MRMGLGKFHIMSILQGVLLAGAAIADASVENHIERSFQVTPGGRLTIDADRGTIEVRTADRDQVDVKIERKVKRGKKWSVEEVLADLPITFDHSDGGVTIRAKYGEKSAWRWKRERNRLQVKFLITVPEQYNVDLKSQGGKHFGRGSGRRGSQPDVGWESPDRKNQRSRLGADSGRQY